MNHPLRSWTLCLSLAGSLLLAGCPSDPQPTPDGGGGGAGGSGGAGGRGGSGGAGGSGGRGGAGGTGGTGGGAGAGGSGGSDARPGDARPDRGPDSRPADAAAGDGGNASPGLDTCFAGLRMGRDSYQIATKVSADGKVRLRIALETDGRIGTSGTYGWLPYRLALEVDGTNVCISDEAQINSPTFYMGSRHNCTDKLVINAGGRRYEITGPDTRTVPPARSAATLSVFSGASRVLGPVTLTTTTCVTRVSGAACMSGGPC